MKTLLLILTLCGSPEYVLIHDTEGTAAGSLSTMPMKIYSRIDIMLKDKTTLETLKVPLEPITGFRCS